MRVRFLGASIGSVYCALLVLIFIISVYFLFLWTLVNCGQHYWNLFTAFNDCLCLPQLGVANGCAEDALSLAETVASFGAIGLEEERYANALARVSKSSMKVRYSFSLLKLMQSIILGTGAGMLIFVTWKTSTTELLAGM